MPTWKHVEILENSRIKYGYRLAVLANWYKGFPHKQIEKAFGLNESENAVLYCLAQTGGLNATDVCQITGRPKNSVSRAIHVLLSRRLVSRYEDVRDKRRKMLDVTPEGFKIFKVAEEAFIASERQMLGALNAEDLAALDALLSKMLRDAVSWPVQT